MATGPQRFGSSGQGPQPFGLFGGGTPFAPVPPLVSRYFNFFDGVQEYVQLAQPVTLSGSFEISVLLYPTADRAHILADNRSGNTDRLFFEEASNKIEIFVAGTAVTFSGFPPENQLSLLTLSRDASNNYTCVLNGVPLTITAGQGAGGSFSFNSIGGQFGGVTGVPPFAGIEANVRIADNGTLIHNWAIDDNSNVIADSVGSNNGTLVNPSGGWGLFDKQSDGDWLGQELITQQVWENPFSVGTQWSFSNNQWTLTGDGLPSALSLLSANENPDIFRISGNAVSVTGTGTGLTAVQDVTQEVLISTAGAYSFDIDIATYTRQQYKRQSGIVNAVIDKPSMKQLLRVA